MLLFEVHSSDGSAQRVALPERDLTLGRDPANELALSDTNVSRFHAVIVLRDSGEYVLRDVGSRNGILVNGAPTLRHVLHPGDEIAIASHKITYRGPDERAGAPELGEAVSLPRRRSEGSEPVTSTAPVGGFRTLPTALDALGLRAEGLSDARLLHTLKCAQVIASTSSVTVLTARLLDSVVSALRAERGFVLLRDGDRLRRAAHLPESGAPEALDAPAASALYGAMDTAAPALSPGREPGSPDVLCIPLLVDGRAIGVVGVEGRLGGGEGTDGLDVATALCGLCAAHVENARERTRLRQQCAELHEAAQASHRLVGTRAALREVLARIHQAAQSDYPVLILGETGTGKGLVARAIHQLSKRRDRRFVALNCAAVPESLLESEMFGYAPHSGIANANPAGKPGKFEVADGGTLFLDEIGDFSPATQAKLLRVLEEQTVERIGSNDPLPVDVRAIAATNMDVGAMAASGRFRADLYHRINVLQITLPPLRERPGDILLLAAYFLEQHVPAPLGEALAITNQTARFLLAYPWPGNVRQLRNAILAASTRATAERLDPEHFDREIAGFLGAPGAVRTLRQVEREHIAHVLEITDGNKRKAARLLGVSPQTLYDKIKEYDIHLDDRTQEE
jgi:transcriptional regulator with GAF, ATPase, and Fis domain